MAGRDARPVKIRHKHSHSLRDRTDSALKTQVSLFPNPMPPPQKGFKIINHRDVQYRWIMQNRRGTNEILIEANAPVNGQSLIGELPKVVSYDMVTLAIDFGNANGWKPNEAGAPFRCKWERKRFIIPEA